ncbi:hypothetical protein AB0B45_28350 [Nonomuraea sp. NPDC049152]|uniref:hypothetical protein n=1 Tax=Nonomuraea sp. NPDC049152 TaxID=3154350 RepID=UPI0033DFA907
MLVLSILTAAALVAPPSRRGRVIEGSTPYGRLVAVSPSFRRDFEDLVNMAPHLRLRWALHLDSRGLVQRFTSTARLGRDEFVKADLRFTGWGSRAAVTAPPAGQVIDESELDDTLPGKPTSRDSLVISR